jgi:hypothetical protein
MEASPAPETQSTESNEALETLEEGLESLEETGSEPKAEAKPAAKDVKKAADKMDAEKVAGSKMYKIIVDGQEEEVSEAELVKMAQMGKSGQKRMQEAAQIRKEAAQLVKMLRDDPESVLADPAILGSNEKVLELAQKILARKIEDEQKSPEVLRAEKAERERDEAREACAMNNETHSRISADYTQTIRALEARITALEADKARLRDALERIEVATRNEVRAGDKGYVSRYGIHGIARAALDQSK